MLDQPHFGRRLRRLRLARGLSQGELAGAGMSTGYLSRLESGHRRPSEQAVAYLADRLGITASGFSHTAEQSLSEILATAISAPHDIAMSSALARAVDEGEQGDPAAHWQAQWMLSRIHHRHGNHTAELASLSKLVELSDNLSVPDLRARARIAQARCLRARGEMDSADPAATEALAVARDNDLPPGDTMAALTVVMSIAAELGALDRASSHIAEVERLIPQVSHTQAAEALWTCAMVDVRQGAYTSSMSRLNHALALVESRDNLTLWCRLRLAAAAAALQMTPADISAARGWVNEASAAIALVGSEMQQQELQLLEAQLARYEQRTDDAQRLCDELLNGDLLLSYRDRVKLSTLHSCLLILAGESDTGIRQLRELGREVTEHKNLDLAAHVWQSMATTLSHVHSGEPSP